MSDPQAMQRFLESGGEKLKPRALKEKKPVQRSKPPQRGKAPKQETFKHKLQRARWEGIKEGFFEMLKRYDPIGPHCFECGVPGTMKTLDLDHVQSRGRAGEWHAWNAALLCNRLHPAGNDCHGEKHGRPRWSSQGEAS